MKKNEIPEFKLNSSGSDQGSFRIEQIEANTGYNPTLPHRHNYYEIFFFQKGGGIHMVDFKEMHIKDFQVQFLHPGQIHYIKREPSSFGWVIKFTRSFFNSTELENEFTRQHLLTSSKNFIPVIQVNENAFSEFKEIIMKLKDENSLRQTAFRSMMQCLLTVLLIKLNRIYFPEDSIRKSVDHTVCERFSLLLEAHFAEQEGAIFYAKKLKISAEKMNQILKNQLGSSARELSEKRLLLESKRLLLHSPLSVKEIAFSLGFKDNSYFNKWFNKLENQSPGQFRIEKREKYHE